jgi:2-keto-4-pentenoate hydratase/2-oxohepta-3-ene-1,7-dioic acid hydratase in catechol pathway
MTTTPSPTGTPADVDPATGLRTNSFALATLADGGRAFPALVGSDGTVTDLSDRFRDLHQVVDDWTANLELIGNLWADTTRPTRPLQGLRPLPLLAHPNLFGAGANYKTHSAQMLTKNEFNQHNRKPGETDEEFYQRNLEFMERRSREGTPFAWTGLHSALVGATDDVVLPALGEEPDWELELGVVLGGTGRFLTPDEGHELIAGYTIVNDLGTVDIFRRTDVPWGYDWISKHQPTFKPTGPFLVPARFFTLDDSIRTTLQVNGRVMQDWPTNDMIFSPAQFVAYLSEHVRLTPGDIVFMGSPPGNGKHHGRFLHDGDVIDSAVTYLGRQRNRCIAEDLHGRKPHFGHFPTT